MLYFLERRKLEKLKKIFEVRINLIIDLMCVILYMILGLGVKYELYWCEVKVDIIMLLLFLF